MLKPFLAICGCLHVTISVNIRTVARSIYMGLSYSCFIFFKEWERKMCVEFLVGFVFFFFLVVFLRVVFFVVVVYFSSPLTFEATSFTFLG